MSKEADELQRIRERKMKALVQEQQRQEALKTIKTEREKEREYLIKAIFLPDAVTYLEALHKTKPDLAARIEDIAITLYSRRQLITRIPKTGVILVQRKCFYEAVRKDLSEQE
jgi:DNA-binding TFAR19-related protein (PDSD5 family)